MLTHFLFPGLRGVRIDRVWREGRLCHILARTTRRAACCPTCQRYSRRRHSRYERTIRDLPCAGDAVILHLQTRRFVCRVPWCRQHIFTERLPALVAPSARRSSRAQAQLRRDGFDLGGVPGARHATADGLPISARTLLRLVRSAPPPVVGAVRVLGVDDWAQRKGHIYGTILVNLETHRVIDLLPDRTAATLADWLRGHPEVEVISRDRGGAYAEGARAGAPQAIQVADRFHLAKNVTEALERYLARKHAALRHAAAVPSPPEPASTLESVSALEPAGTTAPLAAAADAAHLRRDARRSEERRARRHAGYEDVLALHAQGRSSREIARATGLSRHTVLNFLQADGFPERQPRAPRPTLLTPFLTYLRERWDAGCHNAKHLWQELCRRGFSGGRSIVAEYLRTWRIRPAVRAGASAVPAAPTAPPPVACSPRQVCWLLLRPLATLTTDEQAYLTRLYHTCPQVAVAEALVEEFATILRERDVAGWYSWLRGLQISEIAELQRVARSMWQDRLAIEAAVRLDWSNGQVEGQVNRLKVIKRTMYGRANFDLLKQRVLHAA